MGVSVSAQTPVYGVRWRKGHRFSKTWGVSVLSKYLDPANSGLRDWQMNLKKSPLLEGKIMKANGKDWYNDYRQVHHNGILDHRGEHPNAPRWVFNVIGVEYDNYPSNPYLCEMCHGTGYSVLISLEMYEKLKQAEKTTQEYYQETLSCSACNGRKTPPIPWGELTNGR